MSETDRITGLGPPVSVDVAEIDRELSRFWKTASERGGSAVVRACCCNTVVIAQNREEAEALPAILGQVAEWHPSRTIIVYEEPDGASSATPGIEASISAQCSLPFSRGPQVCCEFITLAGHGESPDHLSNSIASVVVPDLRTHLYWRSFREADRPLVERVARFSSILIVDSHQSKDDPASRKRLLALMKSHPAGIPVRDLNWSRLTPWRDLIAQFFDPVSYRDLVYEIEEVKITRSLSSAGSIPTRTLLLTGWLASRLGWRRLSAERRGDNWISKWDSKAGEVFVHFGGELSVPRQHAGISSIQIRTRTGALFSVVREEGSSSYRASAQYEGRTQLHSVPGEPIDEPRLLVREFSMTGEDKPFVSALSEALALEDSFGSPG